MDDAHGGLLRGNPPAIRYKEATLTNQWNFGTDTVTRNITLYAKWTDAVAAIDLSDGTGDNLLTICEKSNRIKTWSLIYRYIIEKTLNRL
jgi:hypothetical protein